MEKRLKIGWKVMGKKKGQNRNSAPFKIQYPMKNRGKNKETDSNFIIFVKI